MYIVQQDEIEQDLDSDEEPEEILEEISLGEYIDLILLILMGVILPSLAYLFKVYTENKWYKKTVTADHAHKLKKNLKTNKEVNKILKV